MRPRARSGGFTLIELLVVVSVLGVVVAFAAPQLRSAIDQARASAVMADMRNVRMAVLTYVQANNQGPRSRPWRTMPPELEDYLQGMPFTSGELDYRVVTNRRKGWTEFRVRYPRNHPVGMALKQYRNPGSDAGSVNWNRRQTRFRLTDPN